MPQRTAPTPSSSPTARWSPPIPAAIDVYDARVGGGFPLPPSAVPCFGDACQPLPPEPDDPTPGTERSKTSGNLPTPPPKKPLKCKKNQVKKFGKCVKENARRRRLARRRGDADEGRCTATRFRSRSAWRWRSLALWLLPSAAQADFGFLPGEAGFNVTATSDVEGEPATLAGSHPYSLVTEINFNQIGEFSDGDLRNLELDLPPGLIENPTSVNKCSAAQFATPRVSPFEESLSSESCPGHQPDRHRHPRSPPTAPAKPGPSGSSTSRPPPGFPSQFGFAPYGVPVTITPRVRETGSEYGLTLRAHEPLPAAQRDRHQDGDLGHALGRSPTTPSAATA